MSDHNDESKSDHLYGAATISEKGQIVIPKQARDELNLSSGDKLLVLDGGREGVLGLAKTDCLEEVVDELSEYLKKNKE